MSSPIARAAASEARPRLFEPMEIRGVTLRGASNAGGMDGGHLTGDLTCTPCGGCRQAIFEAACLSGRDIEVLSANGEGTRIERHAVGSLLPHGFGPANLSET